ncbi:MAG: hypothetical protein GXO74_12400 [Calditrichaeota bacterium]|nr:hypothetical protein [Calditrichota bacterium]
MGLPFKKIPFFLINFIPIFAAINLTSQIPKVEIPDSLAILVKSHPSRPFVFTDRAAAFFYGETAQLNHNGHQGFFIGEKKYLADYLLFKGNKRIMRSSARKIIVFPDRIVREYSCGLSEELTLLDLENVLLLTFNSIPHRGIELVFWGVEKLSPLTDEKNHLFLFIPDDEESKGKIVAVGIVGRAQFSDYRRKDVNFGVSDGIPLGTLKLPGTKARAAIFVANDVKSAGRRWKNLKNNIPNLLKKQRLRLRRMVNKCYFQTNDSDLNLSFYRALISLDQLIIHRTEGQKETVGIFAGLPWFNNYWGRDTFISLPGAALVTGRFSEAKQILCSFADYQNQDSTSVFWGRIPNRVTKQDVIYNTADGTPWFVKSLWEYYLYSGDEDFLKKMYPALKLSVLGTFRYHCDSLNFLTHKDAETWMDAKGGQGAWSPRGNRAVEVQALWFQQLQIAVKIADLVGDQENAEQWESAANVLRSNFRKYFWNGKNKKLFDHLNRDGTADEKIRPNQIFALTLPEPPLLSPHEQICVLQEVVTRLTYPYGVASLSQHDPDFHPYHQLPAFYPKDAAYHNGTVWTWLAGPVISALTNFGYNDLAFSLLKSEAGQILNVGAVGSYSELLNALPRPGEKFPRWSGTISQAWSLAEFIRNCYQDLLGVKPDVPAGKIAIAPHLPKLINSIDFRLPFPGQDIFISFRRNGADTTDLKINYVTGTRNWEFAISLPADKEKRASLALHLQPGEQAVVRMIQSKTTNIVVNRKAVDFDWEKLPFPSSDLPTLKFAVPEADSQVRALQPPPFPLLNGKIVNKFNDRAEKIVEAVDSLHDDFGPNGAYRYPTNANFKAGILDLRKFQVFSDDENYYFALEFRDLAQPNWHPEYGFQLTYAAIAIDQKLSAGGRKRIGRNANYSLPDEFSAERFIFVGGGIEIENDRGEIITAFRPADAAYPIGDVARKRIRFAVPKKYLGSGAGRWKWAVLVGAQDDHGGAGIGEFRCVAKKASEWQGGGAETDCHSCNVYDFLFVGNGN